MFSKEVTSGLTANPAWQELVARWKGRHHNFLTLLPREKDSDERLRLSGRCLELEDILNDLETLLKGRHDLEPTAPEEEL